MAKSVSRAREGMSFVTMVTDGRRPVFAISRVADLFVETLKHYRMRGHYKLHAYVVMPDHVHLVLTPQAMTLEQAVNLIKTGFAHRLETELPIWETDFKGYAIATNRDLEVVRSYLHQLPVSAEMVEAAEMYPHSSAYRLTVENAPALAGQGDAGAVGGARRRAARADGTAAARKKAS